MRRCRPAAARPGAFLARAAVPIVVALLTSVVAVASPAGAESEPTLEELRRQQRAVQQQQAAKAARVDVLKADNRELADALEDLERNRRAQQGAVEEARRRSAATAARSIQAKAAEEAKTKELEHLRGLVRRLAIDEYIRGATPEIELFPDPSSPMDAVRRRSLLSAAVGRSAEVAGKLRAAKQDLEIQRTAAEEAARAAAAEERRLEEHLTELDAATRQQRAIADQIERKLEAELAEADALRRLDSRLASRIAAGQAEVARRLRSTPAGSRTVPGNRRTGPVSLSTVRGITVASSIAGRLASLLEASDAAGLSLGGGGYRDSSDQVALRRAHCGTTDYDIYDKPASECSPPTARPGQSMHEQGLAVDFTNEGSLITSRGNAAFRWLEANASRYGLYNLPSEPWHWSVNGD